jgi:hypothetical protein
MFLPDENGVLLTNPSITIFFVSYIIIGSFLMHTFSKVFFLLENKVLQTNPAITTFFCYDIIGNCLMHTC